MSDAWWIIEEADGTQHVIAEDPTPIEIETDGEIEEIDRYPEAVKRSPLPGCLDLVRERWDFDTATVIPRWSAEDAAALRWEDAKRYRDVDRYYSILPVSTVVSGMTVMVERSGTSREKIETYALCALLAITSGSDFTISFTDGSQPENQHVSLNAQQIAAVKVAIAEDDARCHAASQVIRNQISAALADGASAAEILSIDVTAGYPVYET